MQLCSRVSPAHGACHQPKHMALARHSARRSRQCLPCGWHVISNRTGRPPTRTPEAEQFSSAICASGRLDELCNTDSALCSSPLLAAIVCLHGMGQATGMRAWPAMSAGPACVVELGQRAAVHLERDAVQSALSGAALVQALGHLVARAHRVLQLPALAAVLRRLRVGQTCSCVTLAAMAPSAFCVPPQGQAPHERSPCISMHAHGGNPKASSCHIP